MSQQTESNVQQIETSGVKSQLAICPDCDHYLEAYADGLFICPLAVAERQFTEKSDNLTPAFPKHNEARIWRLKELVKYGLIVVNGPAQKAPAA